MNNKQHTSFKFYLIMLFLNSFVDLGHKITIQNIVFKVYDGQQQIILIAIVNSLILLPYVLLFTPAAYFSNRFALVKVMRVSAWIAVSCSALIVYFYYQGSYQLAFIMTLMLAIQSAIYSPAKYGYIKLLMGEAQLVTANAKVQVATIVAILSGTLIFSILFEMLLSRSGLESNAYTESGIIQAIAPLGWLLVASTCIELWMSYRLPDVQAGLTNNNHFNWSEYLTGKTLRANLSAVTSRPVILYCILGLSIFWGLSQMVLAAFPAYAKQYLLETNAAVIQAILACSGVGIFMGSVLVSKISKRTFNQPVAEWHLRLQLIPFGAVGFGLCLGLITFVGSKTAIALCFFGVGFFGAFFIVPLNAIIQSKTKAHQIGTVLAGNNWLQNISMLGFLLLTIVSAMGGFNAIWLFYIIAIIALISAFAYLCFGLRDFLQFTLGGLFGWRYKIITHSEYKFPVKGAVLLLGNHVSWLDWAFIQLATPRPIRFVIDRSFYEHWLLHNFLKHIGTIAISPKRSKDAIKQIRAALNSGAVVCLFPEGKITHDGEFNEFRSGYELASREVKVDIVPFYIGGVIGSRFSRVNQPRVSLIKGWFGLRRVITVTLGLSHKAISSAQLTQEINALKTKLDD